MKHNIEAGFSLVEYIIILSVLILIGYLLHIFVQPIDKAEMWIDDKKKTDLLQMVNGLEQYRIDHSAYPRNDGKYLIANGLDGVHWGAIWDDHYIHKLPIDINFTKSFAYYSDGNTFYIFASLERGGKDKDACHPDGRACDAIKEFAIPDNICGDGAVCNYVVTSNNIFR